MRAFKLSEFQNVSGNVSCTYTYSYPSHGIQYIVWYTESFSIATFSLSQCMFNRMR